MQRDVAELILPKPDGGYTLAGRVDDLIFTNQDYYMASYLIDIDSAGNVENEWVSNTSGLRGPALDLLPAPNGHFFVSSSHPVAIPIAGGEMLMYQNAVYELDENRNIVWDYFLDHKLDAEFLQSQLFYNADTSSLIIAGTVYDSLPNTTQYRRRAWLQAFDLTTKEVLWRRYIEAPVVDYGAGTQIYDIEQLPDGGYLLCGDARDNDPNEVPQQLSLIHI